MPLKLRIDMTKCIFEEGNSRIVWKKDVERGDWVGRTSQDTTQFREWLWRLQNICEQSSVKKVRWM